MAAAIRKHPGSYSFLLGVVATMLVGSLWLYLTAPPPAFGQLPDSGAQRQEQIKEQKEANRKLAEIADLLRDIRDDARKERAAKSGSAEPKRP